MGCDIHNLRGISGMKGVQVLAIAPGTARVLQEQKL